MNLLVAFDVLMQERSVTKAADRLFVGQSAMSATLNRLRIAMGDPILVRHGRNMVPTPQAEAMASLIREILDKTSAALSSGRGFDPRIDQRSFVIGTSDYVTFVFLRHCLKPLREEAPNIRLNLRPVGEDFINDLRNHRLDMLITAEEAVEEPHEFHMSRIFSDRYVCVVDKDNKNIGGKISIKHMETNPYISTHIGRSASLGELKLDALGIKRNIKITTTFLMSCFLVSGSNLMTLAHYKLAKEFSKILNLRLLDPPIPISGFTETIFWTVRHEQDPGHKWLRQRLRSLANQIFENETI